MGRSPEPTKDKRRGNGQREQHGGARKTPMSQRARHRASTPLWGAYPISTPCCKPHTHNVTIHRKAALSSVCEGRDSYKSPDAVASRGARAQKHLDGPHERDILPFNSSVAMQAPRGHLRAWLRHDLAFGTRKARRRCAEHSCLGAPLGRTTGRRRERRENPGRKATRHARKRRCLRGCGSSHSQPLPP